MKYKKGRCPLMHGIEWTAVSDCGGFSCTVSHKPESLLEFFWSVRSIELKEAGYSWRYYDLGSGGCGTLKRAKVYIRGALETASAKVDKHRPLKTGINSPWSPGGG